MLGEHAWISLQGEHNFLILTRAELLEAGRGVSRLLIIAEFLLAGYRHLRIPIEAILSAEHHVVLLRHRVVLLTLITATLMEAMLANAFLVLIYFYLCLRIAYTAITIVRAAAHVYFSKN